MSRPCVCVLTPVYNGEKYIAECIESVLAQDYTEFEYHIVDNCSTDGTLDIVQSYAQQDCRIRVRTNSTFVGAIDNHNRAFELVPLHCKYCKVVSADDWIVSRCLSTMVSFAETHPTVGIVGSHQRSGHTVKWRGFPFAVQVMSGRDAARLALLERVHFLGTPTSVLYRADLVRMRRPFFPHTRSHADASVCYEAFRHWDFGFVAEVLSEERVHPGQWSTRMDAFNSGSVAYLEILLTYGSEYLSASEFETLKRQAFDAYYRDLGGCIWKLKGREFWTFHRSRLSEIGHELVWSKVVIAAMREVFTEAKDPVTAMRKVRAVMASVIRHNVM